MEPFDRVEDIDIDILRIGFDISVEYGLCGILRAFRAHNLSRFTGGAHRHEGKLIVLLVVLLS
jgi:hypothetical protein